VFDRQADVHRRGPEDVQEFSMSARLIGRRIAILADDGVDTDELQQVWRSLSGHAADVVLLSVAPTPLLTIDARGVVDHISVDAPLGEMRAGDYAALVIPSGRGPHGQLRYHRGVTRYVRDAVLAGTVTATGCLAAGVLVAAGLVRGRRVTSGLRLRHELLQAGGYWTDIPVARDTGVLTTQRSDMAALAGAVTDEVSAPAVYAGLHGLQPQMTAPAGS
jgi:protease I